MQYILQRGERIVQQMLAFFLCEKSTYFFFYLAGYYIKFLKMNASDTGRWVWMQPHALSVISVQREFRRDFGSTPRLDGPL